MEDITAHFLCHPEEEKPTLWSWAAGNTFTKDFTQGWINGRVLRWWLALLHSRGHFILSVGGFPLRGIWGFCQILDLLFWSWVLWVIKGLYSMVSNSKKSPIKIHVQRVTCTAFKGSSALSLTAFSCCVTLFIRCCCCGERQITASCSRGGAGPAENVCNCMNVKQAVPGKQTCMLSKSPSWGNWGL